MNVNLVLKNKYLNDENLRWCEIYKITNTENLKVYIGQAVSHRISGLKIRPHGMENRFKQHKLAASNEPKPYYQCNALNRAMRKYGIEKFTLQLVCYCSLDDANRVESDEIIKHNSIVPNGYNITTSCKSIQKPSIEFRTKISAGHNKTNDEKRLETYNTLNFEGDNIEKYIVPLKKQGEQIGWQISKDKKNYITFKSSFISLDQNKQRAIDFILNIKNIQRRRSQIAGNLANDVVPFIVGNNNEEHG
jgi:hypothetical protein